MGSSDLDTTTVLLVLLGAIVVLPLLLMGVGGMAGVGHMGAEYGYDAGWMPVVAMLGQLVVVAVLLGGGYLLLTRRGDSRSSSDPAVDELRAAYARGDLTDEEFETRRETLRRSE